MVYAISPLDGYFDDDTAAAMPIMNAVSREYEKTR